MKKILVCIWLALAAIAVAQTFTQINPGRIGWGMNPTSPIVAGTGRFSGLVTPAGGIADFINPSCVSFRGVVNARDCEAKGDGITDDTPALDACAAVAQAVHAKCYIPPSLTPYMITTLTSPGSAWTLASDGTIGSYSSNTTLTSGAVLREIPPVTGGVNSLYIVSIGSATYSTPPTVTIAGGGGSGATAVPVMYGTNLAGFLLTSSGSGYTSAPAVTLSAPTSGTAPTVVASLTRGPMFSAQGGNHVYIDGIAWDANQAAAQILDVGPLVTSRILNNWFENLPDCTNHATQAPTIAGENCSSMIRGGDAIDTVISRNMFSGHGYCLNFQVGYDPHGSSAYYSGMEQSTINDNMSMNCDLGVRIGGFGEFTTNDVEVGQLLQPAIAALDNTEYTTGYSSTINSKLTITNNYFESTGYLSTATNAALNYITINAGSGGGSANVTGNTLYGPHYTPGSVGIELNNAYSVNVSGNSVVYYGIDVDGANANLTQDLGLIAGNVLDPQFSKTVMPTVNLTVSGGSVTGVSIPADNGTVEGVYMPSGGANYSAGTYVTLSGGGGTGATATPAIQAGGVIARISTTPGSGYTSAPTCTITDPLSAGSGASCQAVIAGGMTFTAPNVAFSGGGCTTQPIVYLADAQYGGNGFFFENFVPYNMGIGMVSSFTVTNGGSGYTTPPSCTVSNTGSSVGSGALCYVSTSDLVGGVVQAVHVGSLSFNPPYIAGGGSNYTSAGVSFSGGGGSGLAATVNLNGYRIAYGGTGCSNTLTATAVGGSPLQGVTHPGQSGLLSEQGITGSLRGNSKGLTTQNSNGDLVFDYMGWAATPVNISGTGLVQLNQSNSFYASNTASTTYLPTAVTPGMVYWIEVADGIAGSSIFPTANWHLCQGSNWTSTVSNGISTNPQLFEFAADQSSVLHEWPCPTPGVITNADLANPTITITPGVGLSGGGSVPLGGTVTLTNTVTAPVAASTNPLMNGTAAPGTSSSYARADHVHPSDSTKATITGTPVVGNCTNWTSSGIGDAGAPCVTTAGIFPQRVAAVAPATTSSTTGIAGTTIYTPSAAGYFRGCMFLDITVAGTAGTYQGSFVYTSDGHAMAATSMATVSTTTQWNNSSVGTAPNSCATFYADAGQIIQYKIFASGVTGTPTARYTVTLEQLE